MTNTGLDVLDTSLEKTNIILKEIEEELGWQGRRHQAYTALRAVLHALRDRLRIEEAANFSAQLPLIVKGIFYDEWKPEDMPIKMDRGEFLARIAINFPFEVSVGIEGMTKAVLGAIFNTLDPKEVNKFALAFPKDLAELIKESVQRE